MLTGLGPRSPLQRYLLTEEPEGGDEGGGGGGGNAETGDKDSVPKSRVNEIVNSRVAETKTATEKRIAEELGVPISEAKEILAAHQKRVDGEKSEAQREKDAATKARQDADNEKAAAAKERQDAKIERALVRAGIADEKLDRAVRLLDVESDADAEAIKKAAEALKSEEPAWFGDTGDGGGTKPPKAPGSDSKGKPPKNQKSEDAFKRGEDRAKESSGTKPGTGPGGYNL